VPITKKSLKIEITKILLDPDCNPKPRMRRIAVPQIQQYAAKEIFFPCRDAKYCEREIL